MSLVSLVVPVYNMEQYLKRSMQTLLNLKNTEYEIIIVDDGSTDSSPGICDDYAEKYPDLVRIIHKKNGGLSSARNAGIDAAEGEYIIFPDPDDWVENDYLEKLINLQTEQKAELVCTGHFIDYDHESILVNTDGKLKIMSGLEAQRTLLIPPCMSGFAWNKLYHLGIIREHQLYFGDDVGTTEDLDFAFRYLQYCNKVCFAPEYRTYHYYQRPGAATHSGFSEKKLQAIHTYEKMIASSTDQEIITAAKEEICNTAINLIPMYWNSKYRNEESYQKIRSYIKGYYSDYMASCRYGKGRKLQAKLARYTPKLYVKFKNIITK